MFWLGKSISIEASGSGKKKTLNLSPLEVIILIQLRAREIRNKGDPVGQYGYEMIQDLNDLFAGAWEAKSGTIYPILSKLEKTKSMIIGSRKKSPLGPVKKVYILEDYGRDTIDRIISNNFDSDIEFMSNFLNLISPFVLLHNEKDQLDEVFEKLLVVPEKIVDLAKNRAVTEIDQTLRNKKLTILHKKLSKILGKIETEIAQK